MRVLAGAMAAVLPWIALAHAALLESTPGDGEVVATSPPAVVLRFNSRIEKRLTRAVLTGADGRATTLAADESVEDSPDRVSIRLPPLPPGAHRLSYRVLASDGHASSGQIRFTVQGGGSTR
jgi:methionine-rich copper-binding protein CopC